MTQYCDTAPGAPPEAHGFGCTPEECLALLRDLRRIPGLEIGFHLDVGHARNNSPYSTLHPVGAWYGALGAACNGMHLHQVCADERGGLHNHLPLEGLFDGLVSLASLVLARRDGLLRRAPMFVEVRGGGESSVRALRAAVSAG